MRTGLARQSLGSPIGVSVGDAIRAVVVTALCVMVLTATGDTYYAQLAFAGGDSCPGNTTGSSYCPPGDTQSPVSIWAEVMDYSSGPLACWGDYCHGHPNGGYGTGGPIPLLDSGGYACYNECEYCCLYNIFIRNNRANPVVRLDLCTNNGTCQ
jgi:hypothetical protein